jgi:hypothetical protein
MSDINSQAFDFGSARISPASLERRCSSFASHSQTTNTDHPASEEIDRALDAPRPSEHRAAPSLLHRFPPGATMGATKDGC